MNKIGRLLIATLTILFLNQVSSADISIVKYGLPLTTIQIGALASPQERFAAEEIQTFIRRFTNVDIGILTNREPTLTPTAIVLGTLESNPTVCKLLTEVEANLGDEGYQIATVELASETVIVITANTGRGVLYGAYALIETCITALTGLTPVDIDFNVVPQPDLTIPVLNQVDKPFYPVRATLEVEDPDWLARHRINMSGAEGVWTGTGNDDGLGTAFKYVDTPAFEPLQDESLSQRQERIRTLRERFDAFNRRGIDAFLFMYITGEPTEALIERRPELLGPAQPYRASRNRISYRPFCWSNPEFHQLAHQLVTEIIKTYPTLSGFHLRAWGNETRACNCDECGGQSEKGQEMLWQVVFTIVNAARELRPDFKFYLSGYDGSWLKDPVGQFAQQLPRGTIFSQKWGYDGEPVSDPRISTSLVNRLRRFGHHLIVLSHDVEEVMPFWMLEGDLFAEGVQAAAMDTSIEVLSGFTLQGAGQSLGYLDRILSARMNWEPQIDGTKLLENNLATQYGADAALELLSALQLNAQILSSYFSDFGGSLSYGGRYGYGSTALATRFWDIIGEDAVNDTLAIPNVATARAALRRFAQLAPQQHEATSQMRRAEEIAEPVSPEAANRLGDAMNLMHLWAAFFQGRLHLLQAIVWRYESRATDLVQEEFTTAAGFSESMIATVQAMDSFVPLLGYSEATIRFILTEELAAEIALLDSLAQPAPARFSGDSVPLEISRIGNFPNPFERETTLTYGLTKEAETVTISIYSQTGRRVRVLTGASALGGVNEVLWDGRNEKGERLASGVYFYKIRATAGDEQDEALGHLVILK